MDDGQILAFLLAFGEIPPMPDLQWPFLGIGCWQKDPNFLLPLANWKKEFSNFIYSKAHWFAFIFSIKIGHNLSKKNKTTNGSIELPKIKFANHSPINVGNSTPNSSLYNSSTNNADGINSAGIGNGAMSACSEFSSTAEIQFSSSSNNRAT